MKFLSGVPKAAVMQKLLAFEKVTWTYACIKVTSLLFL